MPIGNKQKKNRNPKISNTNTETYQQNEFIPQCIQCLFHNCTHVPIFQNVRISIRMSRHVDQRKCKLFAHNHTRSHRARFRLISRQFTKAIISILIVFIPPAMPFHCSAVLAILLYLIPLSFDLGYDWGA